MPNEECGARLGIVEITAIAAAEVEKRIKAIAVQTLGLLKAQSGDTVIVKIPYDLDHMPPVETMEFNQKLFEDFLPCGVKVLMIPRDVEISVAEMAVDSDGLRIRSLDIPNVDSVNRTIIAAGMSNSNQDMDYRPRGDKNAAFPARAMR